MVRYKSSALDKIELTPDLETASKTRWTRQDYLLLTVHVLIKTGDAVELYLPGVITQVISCELGVSRVQEGLLGVVMYLAMAVTYGVSGPLSDRFGRRPILLTSLYTSILFTILCSVVPNYYTLLLSRALIGLCVGLNNSTTSIYLSENASSRHVYKVGSFIASISFGAGGAWVGICGYLVLGTLGWRVFVLCTSIPMFIPPILLLHFWLAKVESNGSSTRQTTKHPDNQASVQTNGQIATETDTADTTEKEIVASLKTRIAKTSILCLINLMQGHGSILLLPALLRQANEEDDSKPGSDCSSVVQGSQLLILSAVYGGGKLIGVVAEYLLQHGLQKKIHFCVVQGILAIGIALSYGVMLFQPGIVYSVIAMGVAKIIFSMMCFEIALMIADKVFFGKTRIAIASGIACSVGALGSVLGVALAVFVKPHVAVWCTFVVSCVQVGVAFSIYER